MGRSGVQPQPQHRTGASVSGLSSVGVGPGDLSARLKLVDILPTAATALLVGSLLMAGAPQHAPSVKIFTGRAHAYGAPGLIALSVVVTAVSVALQPLELSIIRLLEGYWPRRGLAGRISEWAIWIQERR